MKYILNESPVKTTNNFRINNIEVDLDLNLDYKFGSYEFIDSENINIKEDESQIYKSAIGLTHDKYKKLNITVDKNCSSDKTVIIKYRSIDSKSIIDEINFNLEEESKLNVLLIYKLNNDEIHDGSINIYLKDNASLNLTVINESSTKNVNIQDFNSNLTSNSNLKINVIDFYGSKRIYRSNGISDYRSSNNINMIFAGKSDELIDINFALSNKGKHSKNNINVEGCLFDKSNKHFKGTIDFLEGSDSSIGKEKERTLLLSNDAVSKSLPIMLCHEENVEGSHAVSTGKPDLEKLFYLQSRGISYNDALNMMIKANFSFILKEVPEDISEYVETFINTYFDK